MVSILTGNLLASYHSSQGHCPTEGFIIRKSFPQVSAFSQAKTCHTFSAVITLRRVTILWERHCQFWGSLSIVSNLTERSLAALLPGDEAGAAGQVDSVSQEAAEVTPGLSGVNSS